MKPNKLSKTGVFTADSIRETALGFQKSRILLTAYELGLFTALGDKNKTAAETAKIIKTKVHSTERLMNALCASGLLKKKKDKFSNASLSLRFLAKGNPDFMAGLMHVVRMWDNWSTLTQAVRRGKSILAKPLAKRGKKWLTTFIAAMHERACQQARQVIYLLELAGVSRVLDVGGGSGAYAMAFIRAKKGIRATVFDLPGVAPITRSYLRQEGLLDKVKTISGDYMADDFGDGFDLVFLSAIIHINSCAENRTLIRKCVKALNPQGQLVVQDFIMEESRTKPALGALFSLNMLVATESGDTYTEPEVRLWMQEAGLSGIKRRDTDFGTTLIIGQKA